MLVLAIDTTTRGGSLCLWRDGRVIETSVGDAERTHATRLPGDVLDCVARHGVTLAEVDVYGVAAGPGSFTGLRIGIATIQGLAFANGRQVVGVSTLDALAETAGAEPSAPRHGLIGAWVDAQRAEVYACLYRPDSAGWTAVSDPVVARPERVLDDWERQLGASRLVIVGDGAVGYGEEIERRLGQQVEVVRPAPLLAPAIAALAARAAAAGLSVAPHAVKPVYVRRPDAVLARERRSAGTGMQACDAESPQPQGLIAAAGQRHVPKTGRR
jgi:tRNA threonylcarbamoyladenosine biosynthesis protein TsaB